MGKFIVYQLLPRLWGAYNSPNIENGNLQENGCGKFTDIDEQSLDYLLELGVSHLWLTGILKHATGESGAWVKGKAGSPYAINDYFDTNAYLANEPKKRMEEFQQMVDRIHAKGLKLIIDFVPNHLARDYKGYFGEKDDKSKHWEAENDFYYYPDQELTMPIACNYKEFPAKASGNCFSPSPSVNDWFDTIKLNYCEFHTSTWDKMLEVLLFWLDKGVDGFRCDMVELVPKEFLTYLIAKVKEKSPETIFIAEVYQKPLYQTYVKEVGFDYLYDKSGLYDSLRAIYSGYASCKTLTYNWQFLGEIQNSMLNFLENHDEQRFASDFWASNGTNVYASLFVSLFMNQSPFMLYFGQEIGERGMDQEGFSGLNGRTTIFDWWQSTSSKALYKYIHGKGDLNSEETTLLLNYKASLNFAKEHKAISEGAFYDLCYCNYNSKGFDGDRHYVFLRYCEDEILLIATNFSDIHADFQVVIPEDFRNSFPKALPTTIHIQLPPNAGAIYRLENKSHNCILNSRYKNN